MMSRSQDGAGGIRPKAVTALALALALAGCGGSHGVPNSEAGTQESSGPSSTTLPTTTPPTTGATADSSLNPEAALDATLRLAVDKCTTLGFQRATAFLVSDGLAATVAHSFINDDGELSVAVLEVYDRHGEQYQASLIYLDPGRDVALLRVEEAPEVGFSWVGPGIEFGDSPIEASFVAFPSVDEPPAVQSLEVLRAVKATLDGEGRRSALELSGTINTGDSGAPVFNQNGEVLGVVFASSRLKLRGWAVAASEFQKALSSIEAAEEPIPFNCPPDL